MSAPIGLIGGTGLGELPEAARASWECILTPYGDAFVQRFAAGGHELLFLPRHGPDQATPPHMIRYRANVRALHDLGAKCILASNAVGSLREDLQPGRFVLPDQLVDFTKRRLDTFFTGEEGRRTHIDLTQPFCPSLRAQVLAAGHELELDVHDGGIYLCAEGPRFETAAEICMFRAWGADLVGMTAYPEAALARELGLCYASVCVVTNLAAGMTASPVSHAEVEAEMARQGERLRELLLAAAQALPEDRTCACSQSAP